MHLSHELSLSAASVLLQAFTEARKDAKVNGQQHVLNTQGKQLPESRENCAMQNLVLRLRGGGAPTSLRVSTDARQHMPAYSGYLALAHWSMRVDLVDTELVRPCSDGVIQICVKQRLLTYFRPCRFSACMDLERTYLHRQQRV